MNITDDLRNNVGKLMTDHEIRCIYLNHHLDCSNTSFLNVNETELDNCEHVFSYYGPLSTKYMFEDDIWLANVADKENNKITFSNSILKCDYEFGIQFIRKIKKLIKKKISSEITFDITKKKVKNIYWITVTISI